MTLVVTAAFALALSTSVLLAQQPPHQHDAAKQPPAPSATPGTPAPAMEAHMAKHMEMCRHMMGYGGMMGGGMGSGMMGGGMGPGMMGGGDPKQQAEMMAMRGEMMKAMGEIMMKYAQRMQSTK
ncbi:MAG TPA: hypothetical protein VJU81_22605 [Methylomirabilota bacterium]|nr:hypothetical protein [Methylomirabilota bacterium]